MTLEEAKDQVAKRYNMYSGVPYENWEQMEWSLKSDEGLMNLISRLDEAARLYAQSKQAEAESKLRNLLAIIHRDGGHYVEKYGLEKAIQDARTGIQAFQAEAWGEGYEVAINILKEYGYSDEACCDLLENTEPVNPYLNQQHKQSDTNTD